jgi:predicted dehydrogenase
MKTIRWGILAPGRIAHKFAQDLVKTPNARLMAVGSRSLERAQEFAGAYEAPYAYGSYEELLTCPELDIIYIASPHIGHFEHTMLCLNAGVAVLCEKPFAMNYQQVEEMVRTARAKKIFLMEALWSRFMPTILKTWELIEQGVIGKVLGVKADFGFKGPYDVTNRLFNPELGGGALLDIGIYPVFWSYLHLGLPTSLKASAVFSETGVDASNGMVMTYHEQQFAFLDSTFMAKTACEGWVYGEKGNIKVHGRWHESQSMTLELYTEGREVETQEFSFGRDTWGYGYEIEAVGRCLSLGLTECPEWSLDHSLDLIRLLDDIRSEMGLRYDAFDA